MTTLPEEVLAALQFHIARASLGPSSMRGAGSTGVVGSGLTFLGDLDLGRFSTSNERRFQMELDRATDGLLRAFPRGARHWGLARKGLNIFLRECLYTVYVRDAHNLAVAEELFEIPLDSLTGQALYEASKRSLPRWRTVRGLERSVRDGYQQVAGQVAYKRRDGRGDVLTVWFGQQ